MYSHVLNKLHELSAASYVLGLCEKSHFGADRYSFYARYCSKANCLTQTHQPEEGREYYIKLAQPELGASEWRSVRCSLSTARQPRAALARHESLISSQKRSLRLVR